MLEQLYSEVCVNAVSMLVTIVIILIWIMVIDVVIDLLKYH